jgi:hypothetical protein
MYIHIYIGFLLGAIALAYVYPPPHMTCILLLLIHIYRLSTRSHSPSVLTSWSLLTLVGLF